jgi:hypothetical protein
MLPFNISVAVTSSQKIMDLTSLFDGLNSNANYLQVATDYLKSTTEQNLGSSRLVVGTWAAEQVFLLSTGLVLCISACLDVLLTGEYSPDEISFFRRNQLRMQENGVKLRLAQFFLGVLVCCLAGIPNYGTSLYTVIVVLGVAIINSAISFVSIMVNLQYK